jgi:hypothetical protein
LGHTISTEGIAVDPKKIEDIRGWSTLLNSMEVRSFMGIEGYYRRLIKGFSNIASLITSFQKKGVKFEWNHKCKRAFNS